MREGFRVRSFRTASRCRAKGSPSQATCRRAFISATVLVAALGIGAVARAECLLVHERELTYPIPHLALHFGDPADVPLNIRCSTTVDKNLPTLAVPIYAYNLGEGVGGFRFALRTPSAPTGFDRGPGVTLVQMNVDSSGDAFVTGFDLATSGPVCGPALLGRVLLSTAALPESFQITMVDQPATVRCAARTLSGEWRSVSMDHGGAFVGPGSRCAADLCASNTSISELRAIQGERASIIDLEWASGTGNYTLLRYRTDGRYPVDPADGEPMAFVPSNITRYQYSTPLPGDLRIAAWSISRTPHGDFSSASSLECGSVASIVIELPVTTTPNQWGSMKNLYR